MLQALPVAIAIVTATMTVAVTATVTTTVVIVNASASGQGRLLAGPPPIMLASGRRLVISCTQFHSSSLSCARGDLTVFICFLVWAQSSSAFIFRGVLVRPCNTIDMARRWPACGALVYSPTTMTTHSSPTAPTS